MSVPPSRQIDFETGRPSEIGSFTSGSSAMCLGAKRKFSRVDDSCAPPKQEFIDPFGTPSPSTDRSNPKRRMASDIAVRSGSNQCQPQSHAATSTVMSRIPESAPVMFHPASSHRSPGIYHTQPGRQSTTINLGDNGYGQNQLSSQQIANRFHVASTPARNITAVPSTIHVQNSFDIYYRHLFAKERGTPLWIPSPNNSLPITYRRKGISIGDVGIITKNGAFDFLFNVCLPHDDEINRNRVPADFSPLNPPLLPENDIQIYEDLGEGAYLSSESIKKDISDVGPSGITFESSACEGAILTIPHGAYTEDLANRAAFKRYLSDNVSSWYKYANGVRGREVNNGDLRLVTGVDKSRAWGMATFANVTEQTNLSLKLRFKPSKDSRVGTIYTWDYSGIADSARSGPGRREIEALWMGDESQGMHAFENQSLFVRTLSAKLQEDQWEKLEYELRTSSILTDQSGAASKNTAGPNFTLGPPSSSARSGASSGSHKTPMSRNGYTVLSSATENLVRISDTPTALVRNVTFLLIITGVNDI
ncbi:hypothetical protein BDZ97DRAFT_1705049 [Flammula alnicola]|nr:hypothetical protein BDZ97DRAFT_1705049 [Flammula alnicola]